MSLRILLSATLCGVLTITCFGQKLPEIIQSDYSRSNLISEQEIEAERQRVIEESIGESRVVRLRQISFVSETMFFNQKLQNNGSIIYNKKLDKTLRELKAHIAKSNPDYDLSNVELYVLRSPAVNAFASDDGSVYVTIGLLARIENEAQLALILCHEFSHYIEKHSFKMATEQVKLSYSQGPYGIVQNDNKEFSVHRFSKDLETEADEAGFKLYVNAGYDPKEYDHTFSMLAESVIPVFYNDVELVYPISGIPMDEEYIPEYNEFDLEEIENQDDKKSTHPNIASRKENFESMLKEVKRTNGKKFQVVDESTLNQITDDAAYTAGQLALYDYFFYTAYCQNLDLYNQYQTPDVKVNLFKSWLGMMIIKNEKIDDDYTDIFTQYGETNQLKTAINDLSEEAVNAATILGAWQLYLQDTSNKEYRDMVYLATDVLRKNPRKKEGKNLTVGSYLKPEWRRLKEDFYNDFFEDLDEDNESEKQMLEEWDNLDKSIIPDFIRAYNIARDYQPPHDFENEGMLIINPLALDIDETAIAAIDPLKSQEMNVGLAEQMSGHLTQYGVKNKVISPILNDEGKASVNGVIYSGNLIFKQMQIRGKRNKKPPYNLFLNEARARQLAESEDCRYLAFTGMLGVKKSNEKQGLRILAKLYFLSWGLFAFPQWMTDEIIEHRELMLYTLIYDVKSGRFVYVNSQNYKLGLNNQLDERIFLQHGMYKLAGDLKYLR
jgi:hypothetical protein